MRERKKLRAKACELQVLPSLSLSPLSTAIFTLLPLPLGATGRPGPRSRRLFEFWFLSCVFVLLVSKKRACRGQRRSKKRRQGKNSRANKDAFSCFFQRPMAPRRRVSFASLEFCKRMRQQNSIPNATRSGMKRCTTAGKALPLFARRRRRAASKEQSKNSKSPDISPFPLLPRTCHLLLRRRPHGELDGVVTIRHVRGGSGSREQQRERRRDERISTRERASNPS